MKKVKKMQLKMKILEKKMKQLKLCFYLRKVLPKW